MWIALRRSEIMRAAHLVGVIVVGVGVAMFLPLVTALLLREWDPALDYAVGCSLTIALGLAFMHLTRREVAGEIRPKVALVATAAGWLAAALVAAVPLVLSGSYLSYLDALFDAMSGLTTSGLTVAKDLDHMAYSHNMWRHLTHVIGGQGIVVAALSLAIGARSGGVSLYEAEGRDERIMPNIVNTTRFIWVTAAAFLALGTVALSSVNLWMGMKPVRALLHGAFMTMAAYDTGGFAPQSQNALYYHSGVFEAVLMIVMIAGTLNFNLIADVLQGDRRELWRNIETRTLTINVVLLVALVAISTALTGLASAPVEAVRKGVFHIISANSGTGHQTIYAPHWQSVLGGAGFLAVTLAMAFGGSVSSTAGGIKAMRFGLIAKAMKQRVREAMSPRSALVREKYQHILPRVLHPEMVGSALAIFTLYVVSYVSGGAIAALYGYPVDAALFESVSATANVGLSAGITSYSMPVVLKLLYIVQMWIGRLEFVAVFALVIAIIGLFRRPIGRTS